MRSESGSPTWRMLRAPSGTGRSRRSISSATADGEPVDALSADDLLYEVGSDGLVPALDDQLRGAGPGAVLEFTDTLPERFGDRAGTEVSFRALVKDVKRKVLPELTDAWVAENTESETAADLRVETSRRIGLMARLQAQMAMRDRVLEELSGLVSIEAPEPLVGQEMESRLHDMMHRLERQGLNIAQYLAMTGQDQAAFIEEMRGGAQRAVLADLALRAVVVQEEIEASEDDLDREIDRLAEQAGQKPQKVRRDLDRRGLTEAVRSDIARGKALQFVVDAAIAVDESGSEMDLSLPESEAVGNEKTEPDDTQPDDSESSQEEPRA